MARPMPRDAPVTSATLSRSSAATLAHQLLEYGRGGLECARVVYAQRASPRQRSAHQAREHLTRSDFEKERTASLEHRPQRVSPPNRCCDLSAELCFDLGEITGRASGLVEDDRHTRRTKLGLFDFRCEALSSRPHEG